MLEGLGAVDWDSLSHANGPAGDLPELIRGLTSPDREVWDEAIDCLHGRLCPGVSPVFAATPLAVPFLLELLTYPQLRCRARLVAFLGYLVWRTSSPKGHRLWPEPDDEPETDESQERRARQKEWVRHTLRAVWAGLDVLLDLQSDLDKRLRTAATYVLGMLVEHGRKEFVHPAGAADALRFIADRMIRYLGEERDDLARASLVFGVSRFADREPGILKLLERLLDDPARPVALSAALCVADVDRQPSARALELLIDALRKPRRTDRLFDPGLPGADSEDDPLQMALARGGSLPEDGSRAAADADDLEEDDSFGFPWLNDDATNAILLRIRRTWPEHIPRVVPLFTASLDTADPQTCETVATPILRLVFGDRKVNAETKAADLSPAQTEVLRHLYDNPGLWATEIANGQIALGRFGLPPTRRAWARLLGIEEPPLTVATIESMIDRLAKVQSFPSLESIMEQLGKGQKSLTRDSGIRRLNLREVGTRAFLPHLTRHTNLEELDLCGIALIDEDLVHLMPLTKLRHLQMPGSSITDRGAAMLSTLGRLLTLNISGARITAKGLESLLAIKELSKLCLCNIPIDDKAISRFASKRPGCRITR